MSDIFHNPQKYSKKQIKKAIRKKGFFPKDELANLFFCELKNENFPEVEEITFYRTDVTNRQISLEKLKEKILNPLTLDENLPFSEGLLNSAEIENIIENYDSPILIFSLIFSGRWRMYTSDFEMIIDVTHSIINTFDSKPQYLGDICSLIRGFLRYKSSNAGCISKIEDIVFFLFDFCMKKSKECQPALEIEAYHQIFKERNRKFSLLYKRIIDKMLKNYTGLDTDYDYVRDGEIYSPLFLDVFDVKSNAQLANEFMWLVTSSSPQNFPENFNFVNLYIFFPNENFIRYILKTYEFKDKYILLISHLPFLLSKLMDEDKRVENEIFEYSKDKGFYRRIITDIFNRTKIDDDRWCKVLVNRLTGSEISALLRELMKSRKYRMVKYLIKNNEECKFIFLSGMNKEKECIFSAVRCINPKGDFVNSIERTILELNKIKNEDDDVTATKLFLQEKVEGLLREEIKIYSIFILQKIVLTPYFNMIPLRTR